MASLNSHSKDLSSFWNGKILWDIPMSQYSTLKVGGPAEAIISVANVEDLKRLVHWLKENDISWWIIGRGSNILVPDRGLSGVTIVLEGEFIGLEKIENQPGQKDKTAMIRAGGGCLLSKAVHFCTANSLTGLEFAVGIPGSIGGAVIMNAGAWDNEIGNLLASATLMNNNGKVFTELGQNLGFTYRGWGIETNTILLDATFVLTIGFKDEIKAACNRYLELRKKKQPLREPSAGSFFKNPPGLSAGRLIDEAGLKGHLIGGAKVSEKHANFIINTGNATATDILNLMHFVQDTVYKHSGIRLEPEVHILGNEG
ncbi:MAG: UDP-N-acetylmuramate dehydrogenase [Desulfobulbaceae bacterium]|nr:UDP-N-acetylmuramate dehydrogenase [Desulfobulbaceae bacterium]